MTHILTDDHRANLARLATKLESLPENYRHFNMADYLNVNTDDAQAVREAERKYALKNGGVDSIGHDLKCGSAACAVGHGPSAGILVPAHLVNEYDVEWHAYTVEFFTGDEMGGVLYTDPFFQWMFGSYWTNCDNHPWGAAARIRYILKHGKPPKKFDDVESEYGEFADFVRLYKRYRITEQQPLPEGFYTPSMLEAFAQ